MDEHKGKHDISDKTLIVDEISLDEVSCRQNVFPRETFDKKLSTKCCRQNDLSTKCLMTKCLVDEKYVIPGNSLRFVTTSLGLRFVRFLISNTLVLPM